MNEEDEAFEELAMKQGHWQHISGWRKKQIMDKIEQAFPNPHRTDMTGMTLLKEGGGTWGDVIRSRGEQA